jgi:DNA-binding CsgD family transcriptional regulator
MTESERRQAEDARVQMDAAYYDEVCRALGRGTPSVLLGTSTRSLQRSLKKLKAVQQSYSRSSSDPALTAVDERARQELPPSPASIGQDAVDQAERRAESILSEAKARAEALERDALERHRQAMGTLVQDREDLERRVDDLRAFERDYRSRLKAYAEDQLRDLEEAQEAQPPEQQVDDLRAFEHEYRSRLKAYLEGLLRDIDAGAERLPVAFPAASQQVRGHTDYELTSREEQVALLAATGATNLQIGEQLHINPGAVAILLASVFQKLGVTSRTALAQHVGQSNRP